MAVGDRVPVSLPTLEEAKIEMRAAIGSAHNIIAKLRDAHSANHITLADVTNVVDGVPRQLAKVEGVRHRPGLAESINEDFIATYPARTDFDIHDAMVPFEVAVTNILGWFAANNLQFSASRRFLTRSDVPGLGALLDSYEATVSAGPHTFTE